MVTKISKALIEQQARRAGIEPAPKCIEWPDDWPVHHVGGHPACDMLVGACACGEIHFEGEFQYIGKMLLRKNLKEQPVDETNPPLKYGEALTPENAVLKQAHWLKTEADMLLHRINIQLSQHLGAYPCVVEVGVNPDHKPHQDEVLAAVLGKLREVGWQVHIDSSGFVISKPKEVKTAQSMESTGPVRMSRQPDGTYKESVR